jgi:hypothetical protein
LDERGVFGLRLPTEREITAYVDPDLRHEIHPSSHRTMWMNQQQTLLAAAIDNGNLTDDGVVPHELSEGAYAQLRAFEDDFARRARADQLQTEVDQRQDEIKSLQRRIDAVDERAASARRHLGRADQQLKRLSRSRAWRLAWYAYAARHRLVRADKDPLSEPLERTMSIIGQAKRELAEAERNATSREPGPMNNDEHS